jgi:hypothetical protein
VRTFMFCSIGLLLGLSVLGCGPGDPRFIAKGHMILDGKPFQTNERGAIRMFFQPLSETGTESFSAEYNGEEGSFKVLGKDLKGIPPGKYRVAIQLIKDGNDVFHNKLAGLKSPITCELVDAQSEVTIDLDEVKDVVQEAKR